MISPALRDQRNQRWEFGAGEELTHRSDDDHDVDSDEHAAVDDEKDVEVAVLLGSSYYSSGIDT